MKIACESCAAKYTIGDDKVAGRVVKIKCKKCGSTIVVNGMSLGADGQLHDGQPSLHSIEGGSDEATQLFNQDGGGSEEWTVNVTDDDQRPMTTAQVLAAYADGTITVDTYLWRDGMDDWLTLAEVPELVPLLNAAGDSAAMPAPSEPQAANAPMGGAAGAAMGGAAMAAGGFGAAIAESPKAPAAAARRADARRPKVDLFGAGDAAPPPSQPFDKHVGERNENSVLFSLSALAAAEEAAAKSTETEKRASLPMPSASAKPGRANGRAGIDLMNIGGGSIVSNPALAPPDLLAPPPPEPPPPPPSMPPPSMAMGPGSMPPGHAGAMQMQMPYGYPPQKKPMGLIIGLGGAAAVLAVIVIVLLVGGGEETVAQTTPEKADTKSATDSADKEEAAKTEEPKDEPTADAKKDADKDKDEDADKDKDEDADKEAKASLGADATPEQIAAFKKAQATAKKDDGKTDDKKKEDPKKKDPADDKKKEEPAATGTKEFSRAEATAALGAAAGSAQGCAKPGGPTGMGKAQVTFAPSGRATSAVVGGPFSGTAVGSCVASIFRSASVSPFKGGAVTVSKSFRIK